MLYRLCYRQRVLWNAVSSYIRRVMLALNSNHGLTEPQLPLHKYLRIISPLALLHSSVFSFNPSSNKTQGPKSAHSVTACWQIQPPSYLCQAAISLISAGRGQRRTPPVCSARCEVKLSVWCADLISSAPPSCITHPGRTVCVSVRARLFVCMYGEISSYPSQPADDHMFLILKTHLL